MDNSDLREKILTTAIRLFAQQGYNATGVRQITKEADTTVSMVSYYFGSKEGILKEIIDDYYRKIQPFVDTAFQDTTSHETMIRNFVNNYLKIIKDYPDQVRIVNHELAFGNSKVENLRTEHVKKHQDKIQDFMQTESQVSENIEYDMTIIWSALMGMVIYPVMLKPIYSKIFLETDQEFMNRFVDIITTMALNGMQPLLEKMISMHDVMHSHS